MDEGVSNPTAVRGTDCQKSCSMNQPFSEIGQPLGLAPRFHLTISTNHAIYQLSKHSEVRSREFVNTKLELRTDKKGGIMRAKFLISIAVLATASLTIAEEEIAYDDGAAVRYYDYEGC
jgi:hypothetical protein